MLKTLDSSKKMLEYGTEFPLSLEKLVIKLNNPTIILDLVDWEKAGLRIGVNIPNVGQGYFNDKPYTNNKEALSEFQHVQEAVRAGNYSVDFYGNNKIKLSIK